MRACRRRLALRAAAVVVAFVAAAPSAGAVEGGREDRATTHAVAIATGGPASPVVRCSGTLIAPNVVLTARHCIARFADSKVGCESNFLAPGAAPRDFWITASPWALPSQAWKNVASWVVPERTDVCGNDLALLVLASPFTTGEATPALPVLTEIAFREAIATRLVGIAGFGASSAGGRDGGTRRSRFDVPLACVPGNPAFSCDDQLGYIDFTELTSGAGPCTGDSGAGAIVTGDHRAIFGVLSRGSIAGGACAEGIYERTDVWSWLITKTVLDAATAASPAPAWALGSFPDHPGVGQQCRGGDCAPEADCVSFDARRSFVCARRCSSGCGDDAHCESDICAPGAAPSGTAGGCAAGRRAETRAGASVWIALSALLVALGRAFARSRVRGGPRY